MNQLIEIIMKLNIGQTHNITASECNIEPEFFQADLKILEPFISNGVIDILYYHREEATGLHYIDAITISKKANIFPQQSVTKSA